MKLTLEFKLNETLVFIEKNGQEIKLNDLDISDLKTLLHRLPEVRTYFERQYRKLV